MFDLREFRWVYRLSQKDIATILNVSVQAISQWELNKRQMPFDKIVKLTEHFKADINAFIMKNK